MPLRKHSNAHQSFLYVQCTYQCRILHTVNTQYTPSGYLRACIEYWHVMRAQSTLSNIIPVTTRHLKIFHISFLFVLVAYHNFLLFYSKFCLLFTCETKIEIFIKIIIDKKLQIMKKRRNYIRLNLKSIKFILPLHFLLLVFVEEYSLSQEACSLYFLLKLLHFDPIWLTLVNSLQVAVRWPLLILPNHLRESVVKNSVG